MEFQVFISSSVDKYLVKFYLFYVWGIQRCTEEHGFGVLGSWLYHHYWP
jgi:hypothetical protein